MNDTKSTPCLHRIDAECFKAKPEWAKQAFAYKLVHLLFPPELTKRLPTTLRRALVAPGVIIPPGVELPPGMVAAPGAEFPPGWTPGDPWPPGVFEPPELPPEVQITGPTPPTFVEPFGPGPVHAPRPSPPVGDVIFFSDDFDILDPLVWTIIYEGAGGTVSIVDGQLQLNTFPVGSAYIRRYESLPFPDPHELRFKHTHSDGTVSTGFRIHTGIYSLSVRFDPPNQIRLYGPTIVYVTVDNYENVQHEYKVVTDGAFADLYQDNILIYENFEWYTSTATPGRLSIEISSNGLALTDDYTLIDRSG